MTTPYSDDAIESINTVARELAKQRRERSYTTCPGCGGSGKHAYAREAAAIIDVCVTCHGQGAIQVEVYRQSEEE